MKKSKSAVLRCQLQPGTQNPPSISEKLRAFTAIGRVKQGNPYQGDMGSGFKPFRREVEWFESAHAAIEPLLDELDFT